MEGSGRPPSTSMPIPNRRASRMHGLDRAPPSILDQRLEYSGLDRQCRAAEHGGNRHMRPRIRDPQQEPSTEQRCVGVCMLHRQQWRGRFPERQTENAGSRRSEMDGRTGVGFRASRTTRGVPTMLHRRDRQEAASPVTIRPRRHCPSMVVSSVSFVSTTKMASSFAGSVVLAFSLMV